MYSKPSLFNRRKTAICALLAEPTPGKFIAQARNSWDQGADAIGLELTNLPPEFRTVETFQGIFDAVPLPHYVAAYRNDSFLGADDEARQEGMLNAARAGAEIIDVMGDLFSPAPREWTEDAVAIEKQRRLIDEIHEIGAKVVMSSHMVGLSRSAEEVLEQLRGQEERGADMSKIVTRCDSEKDLEEAVRTFFLLNKELARPFIFLGSGRFGRLQRFLGTSLGSAVEFAVPSYQDVPAYNQPTIRSLKKAMENLNWQY